LSGITGLEQIQTVKIDLDTLCWNNGVDFASEHLYEKAKEVKKKIA